MKILEWRIRSILLAPDAHDNSETASVLELYRLAMLVYLNRASGNLLNQATMIQKQTEKAFAIISALNSCDRQFPVFIMGCEARCDNHRAAVLDLINRTENNFSSRSFIHVKLLLQAIWAQDDLSEENINYWDKLSYVITACSILPTFV